MKDYTIKKEYLKKLLKAESEYAGKQYERDLALDCMDFLDEIDNIEVDIEEIQHIVELYHQYYVNTFE